MTASPSAVAPAWVGAVTLRRPDGTVVCGRCVVASSPWRRMRGLLGLRELGTGEGILLRPASAIHCWFMRFAIDAVFLRKAGPDGSREVLATHRNVRPWVGLVPLVRHADGVLELPAGTIEATGTQPGDRVRFD